MSKRKRPRRRAGGGFFNEGQAVSDAEGWALVKQVTEDLSTEGRVLFADDPAVGLGSVATRITSDGQLRSDGVTEQVPVALFEPRQTMVLRYPVGDHPAQESHTEAALLLGMKRLGYGVCEIEPLPGWQLFRTSDGLALYDGNGDLFATAAVGLEPRWVSAAVSQRWVLVLHGPRLGVRTPPGMPAKQYTSSARRQELTEARQMGLVTGGLVRWRGTEAAS